MEPVHGRSPQQIAEDNLLDMLESVKLLAHSRQDAVQLQIPLDRLNKKYKEWKSIFDKLLNTCEDSPAWRERVQNTTNRWIFSLSRNCF